MNARYETISTGDYRSLAEFRYLLRQFLSFSEDAARQSDMAPQQHQALLAIKGFGGSLTIGELAEKLVIQPHSAVSLAGRLVAEKLVKRNADKDDKRRVVLTLTRSAETKLEALSEVHRNELNRLIPLLLKPLLMQIRQN
jgi:DNA-binding MarR family transcriptional regulator